MKKKLPSSVHDTGYCSLRGVVNFNIDKAQVNSRDVTLPTQKNPPNMTNFCLENYIIFEIGLYRYFSKAYEKSILDRTIHGKIK